ncbi:reverse transcriptase [Pelobates cultripes]|uniref:Reverse transcriptase n=1 Tax=Pelobates cultripes TaxID=61616 RepID=A0AAD1VL47_PELCU|nr:reverse transcriptase [Pelobates cultripes]
MAEEDGSMDVNVMMGPIGLSKKVHSQPVCINDVAPAPGVVAPAPGVVAPAPGVVAPAPGVVAPAPGVVAPAPGVVTPAPGVVAPAPGTIAPGVVAPAPGVVAPASGYVAPAPGTIAPAPGTVSPAPGYVAPASGYVAPAPGSLELVGTQVAGTSTGTGTLTKGAAVINSLDAQAGTRVPLRHSQVVTQGSGVTEASGSARGVRPNHSQTAGPGAPNAWASGPPRLSADGPATRPQVSFGNRRNVVRLICGGETQVPDRRWLVTRLKDMGFAPVDLYALIHASGTREFDVSFMTSQLLDRFWAGWEAARSAQGTKWAGFTAVAISRQGLKKVTFLVRNESIPIADILVWTKRFGDVKSPPVKILDEDGIWTGGWTVSVLLREIREMGHTGSGPPLLNSPRCTVPRVEHGERRPRCPYLTVATMSQWAANPVWRISRWRHPCLHRTPPKGQTKSECPPGSFKRKEGRDKSTVPPRSDGLSSVFGHRGSGNSAQVERHGGGDFASTKSQFSGGADELFLLFNLDHTPWGWKVRLDELQAVLAFGEEQPPPSLEVGEGTEEEVVPETPPEVASASKAPQASLTYAEAAKGSGTEKKIADIQAILQQRAKDAVRSPGALLRRKGRPERRTVKRSGTERKDSVKDKKKKKKKKKNIARRQPETSVRGSGDSTEEETCTTCFCGSIWAPAALHGDSRRLLGRMALDGAVWSRQPAVHTEETASGGMAEEDGSMDVNVMMGPIGLSKKVHSQPVCINDVAPAPGVVAPASGYVSPAPGTVSPAPGTVSPAPGYVAPAPGSLELVGTQVAGTSTGTGTLTKGTPRRRVPVSFGNRRNVVWLICGGYGICARGPGTKWAGFTAVAISRQGLKKVTFLVRNESIPIADILVWTKRFGDVKSPPVKILDEDGIWTGGWTVSVLLREIRGVTQHMPNSFFIGADRVSCFYPGQPRVCHKCGSYRHYSNACTVLKCTMCGAVGHLRDSCREIRCHLCSEMGHTGSATTHPPLGLCPPLLNSPRCTVPRVEHGERYEVVAGVEETRLETLAALHAAKRDWRWGPSYFSLATERYGGIAILFKDVDVSINRVIELQKGRCVVLDVSMGRQPFRIINIYGPQSKWERKRLFIEIEPYLYTSQQILFGGDFNTITRPQDRRDATQRLGYDSYFLNKMVSQAGLVDVYLHHTPNPTGGYTYHRGSCQSRIDRFFFKENFPVAAPVLTPVEFSDHHILSCELNVYSTPPKGRGIWRLNSDLLVEQRVQQAFMEFFRDQMTLADLGQTKSEWWEMVKARTQRLFRNLARNMQSSRYKMWRLDILISQGGDPKDIAAVKNLMRSYQYDRYASLVKERDHGSYRSPDPYLSCKRKEGTKSIPSLRGTDGTLEESPRGILKVVRDYYIELLGKGSPQCSEEGTSHGRRVDDFLSELTLPEHSDLSFDELVSEITIEEVTESIQQQNKCKSPGPDGLTAEFYQQFCDLLAPHLTEVFNESLAQGLLPPSMRTSALILLSKPNVLDTADVGNWRPISLLNVDRKVLAKILMKRVQGLARRVLSTSQYCSIEGRTVFDAVFEVREALEKCRDGERGIYLLALDQSKAFDRVDHRYLWSVLRKYGLPGKFVNWIITLYRGAESFALVNGWRGRTFRIRSGVRQGCPLSPLLYVFAVDPFIRRVEAGTLQGVARAPERPLRVVAYADDISIVVSNTREATEVDDLILAYSAASASRVNRDKSVVFWCGKEGDQFPLPDGFPRAQPEIKILGVVFGPGDLALRNWTERLAIASSKVEESHRWKLTFRERVNLIKTYVLTVFGYVSNIFLLPRSLHARMFALFFRMLWGNRLNLIKREVTYLARKDGGLAMVNPIVFFTNTFLKRNFGALLKDEQPGWASVAPDFLVQFVTSGETRRPPLTSRADFRLLHWLLTRHERRFSSLLAYPVRCGKLSSHTGTQNRDSITT